MTSKPQHVVPAERDGEGRREERREHGAGIAGAGDAERSALMLRRIPARGEWQGHGEGSACHAEHDADEQYLSEGMNAEEPGEEETGR